MNYVNLGRTGLKVSRIGLGMMTFGDTRWRSWVLGIDEGRAADFGVEGALRHRQTRFRGRSFCGRGR